MTEFIWVGKRFVSTAAVKAVDDEADGTAVLHYVGGGCEAVTGDDAAALLKWAAAHQAGTSPADAAPAEAKAAKSAKAGAKH